MPDPLGSVARVLRDADFDVQVLDLAELGQCLLAETPHALVLCIDGHWEDAEGTVEEAQATLTNLAAEHPSPRSWDLYVVLSIERPADKAGEILRERIEHDTRYARKFVLAGEIEGSGAVERALRPLLPLHVAASVHLADPLETVRAELLAQGADAQVVEQAIAAFRSTGEIEVT